MRQIVIAGGGPAGAAAAIAARLEGAPVQLVDRATSARHKVCGEFVSPGAAEILEGLGAWEAFTALRPRPIRRCILHLGNRSTQWNLPDGAWGLSRPRLDGLLIDKAAELGAVIARGERFQFGREADTGTRLVVACGRGLRAPRGGRLFGFKAHFAGPCDDAVELYFDGGGYVGVSGIEDGLTNVCGLAPESLLRRYGFDFDVVVRRSAPLSARLGPLRRTMRWIVTGPVTFSPPSAPAADVYAAGDSLGFIDPFTGTGILNALLTGRLAGIAAARGIPSAEHVARCRAVLGRAFLVSSLLRRLAACAGVHWLAPYLPGAALFRLTRASAAGVRGSFEWSRT